MSKISNVERYHGAVLRRILSSKPKNLVLISQDKGDSGIGVYHITPNKTESFELLIRFFGSKPNMPTQGGNAGCATWSLSANEKVSSWAKKGGRRAIAIILTRENDDNQIFFIPPERMAEIDFSKSIPIYLKRKSNGKIGGSFYVKDIESPFPDTKLRQAIK